MAERKSRVEQILLYALGRESSLPPNLSRIESLLLELIEAIQTGGGGGDSSALASRISQLESNVSGILIEQAIQNELIDEKVDIASIPPMTQEEYDALEEKTALYYFIKEDEEEIVDTTDLITPASQGLSYDGFTIPEEGDISDTSSRDLNYDGFTIPDEEVDSYADKGEEY